MAGRWDDTTQASFIPFGFSKTDLQFVDFGIAQEHGLDLVSIAHTEPDAS